MKKIVLMLLSCFGFLLTFSAKGQTAAADNKVSESITFSQPPKGLGIYGIFEGRTPCFEINRQLGANLPADCDHLKWQVIFYRDTVTREPTNFVLTTEMFDRKPLKGKWNITKGIKNNPTAIVYALETGIPGKPLYLLKGDENVLFILDANRELLTGDLNWSYTLNRVKKVRHLSDQ